ncbi:unnamed protein product [Adineta steineri]|uniref:Uncharacterized protein n=1 Tax=Adineta steineri TaxID=433720 RepID=A0A818GE21_9BILA|nr:unnamed protein product [Adineta steineri]CAF3490240.1 unnamed protein product [Adineta steineri]CAF3711695.1 unnamed protein product [Adineta steineri]
MAKKAVKPIEQYSSSDQCLVALLCEPLKKLKTKQSNMVAIKKSEELLRSIVANEFIFDTPTSLASSTI